MTQRRLHRQRTKLLKAVQVDCLISSSKSLRSDKFDNYVDYASMIESISCKIELISTHEYLVKVRVCGVGHGNQFNWALCLKWFLRFFSSQLLSLSFIDEMINFTSDAWVHLENKTSIVKAVFRTCKFHQCSSDFHEFLYRWFDVFLNCAGFRLILKIVIRHSVKFIRVWMEKATPPASSVE